MKLPPGPQTPPFLQLMQWIARPLEYLETSAERYGDIFTAHLGNLEPIVMASNPQALQELLGADPKQFDVGRGNGILKPFVGEQSMLMLDGDRHQRQRQLLTPPLHGERLRTYGNLICEIARQVTNQQRSGKAFPVRSAMQEISLRVILEAVFGLREGALCQQMHHLLSAMLEFVSSPVSSALLFFPSWQKDLGAWSPWGGFLRLQAQINKLIYAEIQQRREQPDDSRVDILSLMMSATDADGQPMTDEELRDELLTLLIGGHETTASAMAWALYWIHTLPEVREKLLAELDNVGDRSDPSAMARLPYLSAVCSETLRIYPVVMLTFPRIVKSPLKLMGYQFESGTVLAGCIYVTHQNEDLYPEPKRFKPERFLERQFSPYEFLPFGGSNRRCIGMAFALFEMKLAIATIVSEYQLALSNNRPVKPVRRNVTLAPPADMQMVVTGARQSQVSKTPV